VLRLLELPPHPAELLLLTLELGGAAAAAPAAVAVAREPPLLLLRRLRLARRRLRLALGRGDVRLDVHELAFLLVHLPGHLPDAFLREAQRVRRVDGGDGGDAALLLHLRRRRRGASRLLELFGHAPELPLRLLRAPQRLRPHLLGLAQALFALLDHPLGGFALHFQIRRPLRRALRVVDAPSNVRHVHVPRPEPAVALRLGLRLLRLVPQRPLPVRRRVVRRLVCLLRRAHFFHHRVRRLRRLARRREALLLRAHRQPRRLRVRGGVLGAPAPDALQSLLQVDVLERELLDARLGVRDDAVRFVHARGDALRGVPRRRRQLVALPLQPLNLLPLSIPRREPIAAVRLEPRDGVVIIAVPRALDLALDRVQVALDPRELLLGPVRAHLRLPESLVRRLGVGGGAPRLFHRLGAFVREVLARDAQLLRLLARVAVGALHLPLQVVEALERGPGLFRGLVRLLGERLGALEFALRGDGGGPRLVRARRRALLRPQGPLRGVGVDPGARQGLLPRGRELRPKAPDRALLLLHRGSQLPRAVLRLMHAEGAPLARARLVAPHLVELLADAVQLGVLLLRRRPRLVHPRGRLPELRRGVLRHLLKLSRGSLELLLRLRLLLRGFAELLVRVPNASRRLRRRRVRAVGERVQHRPRLRELGLHELELRVALLDLRVRELRLLLGALEGLGGALEFLPRALQIRRPLAEVPLLLLHLVLKLRGASLELLHLRAVLLGEEAHALVRALAPLHRLVARRLRLPQLPLHLLQRPVLGLHDGLLRRRRRALPLRLVLLVLALERLHLVLQTLGVAVLTSALELAAHAVELAAQTVELAAQTVELAAQTVELALRALRVAPRGVGALLRLALVVVRLVRALARLLQLAVRVVRPPAVLVELPPRVLELAPRVLLHLLRERRGVVPVIDLADQLLDLRRALVRGGGEELLRLARLAPRLLELALEALGLLVLLRRGDQRAAPRARGERRGRPGTRELRTPSVARMRRRAHRATSRERAAPRERRASDARERRAGRDPGARRRLRPGGDRGGDPRARHRAYLSDALLIRLSRNPAALFAFRARTENRPGTASAGSRLDRGSRTAPRSNPGSALPRACVSPRVPRRVPSGEGGGHRETQGGGLNYQKAV
jgi:hypothetical protein